MNAFALMSLSVGMSMDAFTAALVKGTTNKQSMIIAVLNGGDGLVETIALIMRHAFAKLASGHLIGGYVADFDRWVAFVLLMSLDIRFNKT